MRSKQLVQSIFDRHCAVIIGGSMVGLLAAHLDTVLMSRTLALRYEVCHSDNNGVLARDDEPAAR